MFGIFAYKVTENHSKIIEVDIFKKYSHKF